MKLLGVICLLFLCFNLFAQFNDSTFYYVNLSSGGTFNKTGRGNAYIFNNALKLGISKKSITANLFQGWIYGQQQGIDKIRKLTNNDFTSTLDFNLYKTLKHFYYWGLAAYDKSYSLRINNRIQGGIGVGYSFIDRPNASLVVSNGFLYEKNNLYSSDLYPTTYETIRNSLRVKYKFLFREIITFEGTHFYQPSLRSEIDFIIRSNSTLGIKLYKWVNLNATLNYNRNNFTRSENLFLNYAIVFERYF